MGTNLNFIVGLQVTIILAMLTCGCSKKTPTSTTLKKIPVDSLDGVLTAEGVELDDTMGTNGGSLKITATGPRTVKLYEVYGLDVEDAKLVYRAKVRAENLDGKVYLEMWLNFPGLGEYFSRGLDKPLTADSDWITLETPFFLKKGQNPDMARLNVVIDGGGTVWVDDISLTETEL